MRYGTRSITKEIYDRAEKNNNYLTNADKEKVFSDSELYGYGVYCCHVFKDGDDYKCNYVMGESCD